MKEIILIQWSPWRETPQFKDHPSYVVIFLCTDGFHMLNHPWWQTTPQTQRATRVGGAVEAIFPLSSNHPHVSNLFNRQSALIKTNNQWEFPPQTLTIKGSLSLSQQGGWPGVLRRDWTVCIGGSYTHEWSHVRKGSKPAYLCKQIILLFPWLSPLNQITVNMTYMMQSS